MLKLLGSHLLGFRACILDGADHVEGIFGEVVVLAIEQLAEAADGIFQLDVDSREACEDLCNRKRLREEAFDLSSARDDGATTCVITTPSTDTDVVRFRRPRSSTRQASITPRASPESNLAPPALHASAVIGAPPAVPPAVPPPFATAAAVQV